MIRKPRTKFLQGILIERLSYSDIAVYASYWFFQGLLYMDVRERILKIILDIAVCGILFKSGVPLLFAALLAHTSNMFLNGHVVAMRRHMGHGLNDPKSFITYVDGLYERIRNHEFIAGAAAYGSLSRNNFNLTSDIDIRVFPCAGPLNWARAILWVGTERLRALVYRFPLDLYAFDFSIIDKKMRSDEPPIVFSDPQSLIAKKYATTVSFTDFSAQFKATHVRQ